MSLLYTRNGDSGITSLYNGKKVRKDDKTIIVLSEIDHLISLFGHYIKGYENIQTGLMDICTIIANPDVNYEFDSNNELIIFVENETNNIMSKLPKLKEFILSNNEFHVIRTLCRMTETKIVTIVNERNLSKNIIPFINRLSSLMFALAYCKSFDTNNIIKYKSSYLVLKEKNKFRSKEYLNNLIFYFQLIVLTIIGLFVSNFVVMSFLFVCFRI